MIRNLGVLDFVDGGKIEIEKATLDRNMTEIDNFRLLTNTPEPSSCLLVSLCFGPVLLRRKRSE